MNRRSYVRLCALTLVAGSLASGCLFKSKPVTPRTFILSPASNGSTTTQPIPVEISLIKMPSYLLKTSMVIRKGGNEIQYLQNASWADRLDQLFRQTLTENLSHDLASNQIRQHLRVSIDVQQFDVDTRGQGTLFAVSRISAADDGKPLKSHDSHLIARGPAPAGNPQAIASTMSQLTAQFSRELANEIRGASL